MTYGDYRDRTRAKGIQPTVIVRTQPKPGDKVLRSWAKPVETVMHKGVG